MFQTRDTRVVMVADHFRAFERKSTDVAVRVAMADGEPTSARLVNLGLGGACLEAALELEPGSHLQLEIEAPNLWQPLVVAGQVAWTDPDASGGRFGLTFDVSDPRIAGWLLELLASSTYT